MLKTLVRKSVLVNPHPTHHYFDKVFKALSGFTHMLKIQYSYNSKDFFINTIVSLRTSSDLLC